MFISPYPPCHSYPIYPQFHPQIFCLQVVMASNSERPAKRARFLDESQWHDMLFSSEEEDDIDNPSEMHNGSDIDDGNSSNGSESENSSDREDDNGVIIGTPHAAAAPILSSTYRPLDAWIWDTTTPFQPTEFIFNDSNTGVQACSGLTEESNYYDYFKCFFY